MTARRDEGATPTFVRRRTAARELDIGFETFEAWVRDGTLPGAKIHKKGVKLWRWDEIIAALDPKAAPTPAFDPFTEGLNNEPSQRPRRRAAA